MFLTLFILTFTVTVLEKHFRVCGIWMNDVKTDKGIWFMTGCVLHLVKTRTLTEDFSAIGVQCHSQQMLSHV